MEISWSGNMLDLDSDLSQDDGLLYLDGAANV